MKKKGRWREGAMLGLAVATITWLWIAAVDAVAGDAFKTFTVLGGVAAFTLVHAALNVLYGVILVAALRAAGRAPSLFIAVVFGIVMIQVAFIMLTALLAIPLGKLAWVVIFGGSLVGLGVTLAYLNWRYPFAPRLHRAEAER